MDENNKNIDWEKWYNQNKEHIPEKYKPDLENHMDLLQFTFVVYTQIMAILTPKLKQLMYDQYPALEAEQRPMVVEYIEKFIGSVGSKLLFKLHALIESQNAGVNIREKFPNFEQLVEYYGRPREPKQLKETKSQYYNHMTDEEYKEYRIKENQEIKKIFDWKEKRRFNFIDILQTVLFENFDELNDLNADELIIYAAYINDEYDYYLLLCEHIELFIDCGFPEKDIQQSDEEFQKKLENLSQETHKKIENLRKRRIDGEKV